jgi:hypothetical protein
MCTWSICAAALDMSAVTTPMMPSQTTQTMTRRRPDVIYRGSSIR